MITLIDEEGKIREFRFAEDAIRFLMKGTEKLENQIAFVEQHININGSITRNTALGLFITRLSSIIHKLKAKGYDIAGAWDDSHRDYIYTMLKRPKGKGLI